MNENAAFLLTIKTSLTGEGSSNIPCKHSAVSLDTQDAAQLMDTDPAEEG